MAKILITKTGTLNEEQVSNIEGKGFLVIQTEEPRDIRVIDDFHDIDRDVVLKSALDALAWGNNNDQISRFGKLMRDAIVKSKPTNQ